MGGAGAEASDEGPWARWAEAAGGKTRLVGKERGASKAEPGHEAKSEFGKHILSVFWDEMQREQTASPPGLSFLLRPMGRQVGEAAGPAGGAPLRSPPHFSSIPSHSLSRGLLSGRIRQFPRILQEIERVTV